MGQSSEGEEMLQNREHHLIGYLQDSIYCGCSILKLWWGPRLRSRVLKIAGTSRRGESDRALSHTLTRTTLSLSPLTTSLH
jgi:hypothetical protein